MYGVRLIKGQKKRFANVDEEEFDRILYDEDAKSNRKCSHIIKQLMTLNIG